jgi:hypothetical protein
MSSFWADACNYEEKQHLQDRLSATFGVCSTTVSHLYRAAAAV